MFYIFWKNYTHTFIIYTSEMPALVLHHACRTGKTTIAAVLMGLSNKAIRKERKRKLRPHQRDTLKRIGREQPSFRQPHQLSMMVFSSLVVLQQFVEEYVLQSTNDIVCVCSKLKSIPFSTTTRPTTLATHLLRNNDKNKRPLLLLTTYDSVCKIDRALDISDTALDLAIFDEAHNVHTPEQAFLYSDDVERKYTHRVYMTATPRKQMLDPSNANIYGTNWYTFSYTDAMKSAPPFVKPLRVRIIVGGSCGTNMFSNEFLDIVSIVREIAYRRENNLPIKRVKVYHKRAHDGEEGCDALSKRSAEHFANQDRWSSALMYLHDREEALGLLPDDLDVRNIDGNMSDENKAGCLKWFNKKKPTDNEPVRILLSCQMLREGITLNRVDMTVFADGKGSTRDIVQSGLRGAKVDLEHEDELLDILLLVKAEGVTLQDDNHSSVKETSDEIVRALQSRNRFVTIATVLNALMEVDPAVREAMMDAVEQFRSSDGGGKGSQDPQQLQNDRTSLVAEMNVLKTRLEEEKMFEVEEQQLEREIVELENMIENIDEDISSMLMKKKNHRARFSLAVAPELVQFSWDQQDLLAAHVLHSAAIKIRLVNSHVDNAQKMLKWVEEHDNRIPRQRAKDKEEKALGVWWMSAKSPQGNYVEKYAGVKAVLFGGDSAAQKAIEADYKKTIAARTTMSNEEAQVENAKKMLQWVTEHDNRIPSQSAKDEEEKALGNWWHRAKSPQCNYVEKYADVKAVLFGGDSAAQKAIEADYKKTIEGRTMSKEEVQVENAKKMLQWVMEHDNRIPSSKAKDKEEKEVGKWWSSAKSSQGNYVEKYAGVKAVLFGGDSAAHKKIEADYKKTIAARTTMSNEEAQVENVKKMLQWVEEHDNRIPSKCAKDKEEKEVGIWWSSAKSPSKNYVEKYADVKAVLFGGDSAAQKAIESDYKKTIAARTISKEEVQVDNAKKMLQWVEEHDNRIPSTIAKDNEEIALGVWWNRAKSSREKYVEKYAGVKAVLFGGDSAAQKAIEADYNKTIRKRERKHSDDEEEKSTVDKVSPLLKKRKKTSTKSKKRKRDTESPLHHTKQRKVPQALPNEYGVRHDTDHKQWKKDCNTVFGNALEQNIGKILVLDDDTSPSFGTSSCLVDHHGIRPEQLCIVQYEEDKAENMMLHPMFGPHVVHDSVQMHLQTHGSEYTGIYLDLCGSWETQLRPSLEALFQTGFQDGLVLGVTWGTRNPFGQTEDYSTMMLQYLLMQHASVQLIDASQCEGMRTSFYILTLKTT
jgi:hypothetical protein